MSNLKKIMILQTRPIESISYLTAELVKAFPVDRYQVTLVYLESGEPQAQDGPAYKSISLGLAKADYKGMRLKAMRRLRPFLEANRFDVIIANMYKPTHLLMQLRRSISAPVCIGIIHAFGEFDRWGRRWMMRFMLDSRWCFVGVSAPVRDYLISARCGLTRKNTRAINNAVDLQALSARALEPSEARAALKLPAAGLCFGTLGRCVDGKRHLELLQAFHEFARDREQVYLVIIGDGDQRPALETYITTHNLQEKVHLPGYFFDAARYLRALDVFVFPSESEGFGIALLEAMALGVPALVNQVEPLSTIVAGCGITADSSNTRAFADAMEYYYLLSDAERRHLGQQHRQRVKDIYDIAEYRNQYLQLVEQLLLAR